MERKSSKEYSVLFLVEGKKFKLLNLPSTTSSLLSVLPRTRSAQCLSSQHFAAVLTPNISSRAGAVLFFSVHNHTSCGGPNTFSQENTRLLVDRTVINKQLFSITMNTIIYLVASFGPGFVPFNILKFEDFP